MIRKSLIAFLLLLLPLALFLLLQIIFLLVFIIILTHPINPTSANACAPSSCGNISNISYPFRLETDPRNCGDHRYSLSCENNVTVMNLYEGRYYVQAINYNNFTIRLVDAGLDKHDYSSTPKFPLPPYANIYPYSRRKYLLEELRLSPWLSGPIFFIKCLNPVLSPLYGDSDASYCISRDVNDSSRSAGSPSKMQFSCLNISQLSVSALMDSCSIETVSMFPVNSLFFMQEFPVCRDSNSVAPSEIGISD